MGAFAGVIAVTQYRNAEDAADVVLLVELSTHAGDLVHEVQKERGASALYLASEGASFGDELRAQHAATDVVLALFRDYVSANERELPAVLVDASHDALDELAELEVTRTGVLAVERQVQAIVGWYTGINSTLIHSAATSNRSVGDATTRGDLSAYVELIRAKESAGLERAQLSAAFARDGFSDGQLVTVVNLVSSREAHLQSLQDQAGPALGRFFAEQQSKPVVAEVAEIEAMAISMPDGGFGVNAPEWFALMTERIDLLKEVEDFQTAAVKAAASEQAAKATFGFRLAGLAAVVAAMVPLAIGLLVLRSLCAQLNRLAAQTEVVAEGRFDVEPIEVNTSDEVGRLTNSFNTMASMLRSLVGRMSASAVEVADKAALASSRGEEVSASVDSVANAVEEINYAIQEISQGASRAAMAADDAVVVAQASADAVAELGGSSDEIVAAVDDIRGIAKQTNLLALNATIEAARAGDAGKGFAVVANEVGELAAQTATATDNIATQVDTIRMRTLNVASVNEQIGESIQELQDIFSTIVSAVEEQSATTAMICNTLEGAAVGSRDIAATISELADAAEENRQAVLSSC